MGSREVFLMLFHLHWEQREVWVLASSLSNMADVKWISRNSWIVNSKENQKAATYLSQILWRDFMLKARRLFVDLTKFHKQKSTLVYIVRRSFASGDLNDINMSGKSLPKWIKPEGDGELKLYNSLTREKVGGFILFYLVIFFSMYKILCCLICLMQYKFFYWNQPIKSSYVSSRDPKFYLNQITVIFFHVDLLSESKFVHNNE